MKGMTRFSLGLVATLLFVPSFVSGTSFAVPADYATIQEAVDASSEGDSIMIAPGTYVENVKLRERGAVALIGTGGFEATIIDGDMSDRPLTVEACKGTMILEGLTFQRGVTKTNGGAVLIMATNASITRCRFQDSEAEGDGGGLALMQSTVYTLSDCVIERNSAVASAALNIVGGEGEVYGNTIRKNDGGLTVAIQFTGCDFHDNLVVRNLARVYGPIGYLFGINGKVTRNTVAYNTGKAGSAAMIVQTGKTLVADNLVCNNTDLFGFFVESQDDLVVVTNNNVWGNDAGVYTGKPVDETNFSEDPLFCDAENDDFHLKGGSTCLETGSRGRLGALGKGCD